MLVYEAEASTGAETVESHIAPPHHLKTASAGSCAESGVRAGSGESHQAATADYFQNAQVETVVSI